MATLKSRITPRNGTAAAWAEADPVLLKGEFGLEIDTRRGKYGDGLTPWGELPYADKEMRDLIATEYARATASEISLSEDISKIRAMIKDGASLDEAKAALQALGDNYKDIFSIASTLKSFLEATDAADNTINKWAELKTFLDGITDTESLAGLLSELETKITEAYTKEIDDKLAAQFEDTVFVIDGGNPTGW